MVDPNQSLGLVMVVDTRRVATMRSRPETSRTLMPPVEAVKAPGVREDSLLAPETSRIV